MGRPRAFLSAAMRLPGKEGRNTSAGGRCTLGAKVPCPSPHVTTQKETHNVCSMLNSVAKSHKWILPIQSIGWKEANSRQSKGMCIWGESCLNGKPFSKAHGRFSAMWQLWVKLWPCRTRELHQLSILRHVGLKIPERGSSSCCLD